MTDRFSNIYATEKVVLSFRFTEELDSGETLTSIDSVTVSVLNGSDSSPSSILNGTPALNGAANKALVPVQGVVAGVDYLLKVTCSTSNPLKRLTMIGKLYVE